MIFASIGEHVSRAADRLRAAKIESPRREARLLLAYATGKTVEWIVAHNDERTKELPQKNQTPPPTRPPGCGPGGTGGGSGGPGGGSGGPGGGSGGPAGASGGPGGVLCFYS